MGARIALECFDDRSPATGDTEPSSTPPPSPRLRSTACAASSISYIVPELEP